MPDPFMVNSSEHIADHTNPSIADIELLKVAMIASGVGIWSLQLPDNIVYWDDNCRQLYGIITGNQLSYYEAIQYILPEDRDMVDTTVKAALKGKDNGRYDARYRTIGADDAKLRWVRFTGQAFFDEQGNPVHMNGIAQDITEIVSTTQKALEAQSLAQVALEASNAGSFRLQLDTDYIEYSPALAKIFTGIEDKKLTRSDLIGRISPEDHESRKQAFANAVKTGRLDYEARITWDDGSLHWVHVKGTYIDEVGGGKPQVFTGTAQDITKDKKDREESENQAASIAANEARLLQFVETSPDIITRWDRNLRLMFANKSFEIKSGSPIGQLLGKTILEIGQPVNIATAYMERLQFIFKTGQPQDHHNEFNTAGGRIFYYSRLLPEFDNNGSIQSVLSIARDLSEIKASEERFRLLIEEAPLATCVFVGREMKIEIANEPMIAFWGKGRSVLGKPLAEAIPELISQPFLKILDDVFTSGVTYEAKSAYTQLSSGGVMEDYYFDYTYKPLRNAAGEVYGIMDMAIDVTQQVVDRQKLEESERFATSVFHNSPVAKIVFVGENMRIKTVNENMLKMLGHDSSIIGKPFMDVSPELNNTPLLGHYKNVLLTGETYYQFEEPFSIKRQGRHQLGYYNYIYKGLNDAAGNVYGVMCTATEVTEQVMARQKVEEAEINLRGAIELAELGTWSIDIKTRKVTFSENMMEWFGFASKEEQAEDAFPMLPEQDQVKVREGLAKAIQPGSNGIFNEVYTVVHRDSGQKRIIHAQGKTVLDTSGKLVKVNGTARDITIQQELQLALKRQVDERTEQLGTSNEKLRAANEELAVTNTELEQINNQLIRSNEELAQFAYVASHDLQEPLRKIRLFSGMLGGKPGLPEGSISLVEKIIGSSERMSLLIRDLLDFSKLLKTDEILQPVDLNKVVTAVVNDFEITIEEKGAIVRVGEMPVLQAVSLQMNQLFYNLLGNALKFSNTGIIPVIDIKAEPISIEKVTEYISNPFPLAQYYHISISDNGIGFDSKYSDHIFEVFKRLHGREFYPGSGIGLALCRRIIVNHNGHLYAESTEDEGATFHFILPDIQPNNDQR